MSHMVRGRCHCGTVQYHFSTPSDFCAHCHCESCRRIQGAAFVTWTSVPDRQLVIEEGKASIHRYESSPGTFWDRCANCGSPLFGQTPQTPDRTYIIVASLVDSLDRLPDSHVSYEEHVSWFQVNDDLPHYQGKSTIRMD